MASVEISRRRAAALVVSVASVLLLSGAVPAQAQLGGLLGGGQTTTTTAPPGGGGSPSTTAPPAKSLLAPPPPASGQPATTAPPAGQDQPQGDGADAPGGSSGAMPAALRAMVDAVVRTPANSTDALLAALAPLGQYGLDPTQQALVGFGRFPIAGSAHWSDDWHFPRFGPGWRLHQGVDIFAPDGTPVRAPVDGVVRVTNYGLGGLAVNIRQPDGTYWYMCHLAGLGEGIATGVAVKTGQVVGLVGASGNAKGGASHTHLEVHPKGGPAVPPKPVIDKFVQDAMAQVPALLDAYARAHPQGQAASAPAVPAPAPVPELSTLTPRAALLWASAVSPAGGTLRLVEADAAAAADRIDWVSVSAAENQVGMWLAPLVPRALALATGLRPAG